jgi:hypothetical protein
MDRRKDVERTAYYRRQASTCAKAALTTAVADIRQAYLELEQGWLCLVPKPKEGFDDSGVAEPARDTSESARWPLDKDGSAEVSRRPDARDRATRKLVAAPPGREQRRTRLSPPGTGQTTACSSRDTLIRP